MEMDNLQEMDTFSPIADSLVRMEERALLILFPRSFKTISFYSKKCGKYNTAQCNISHHTRQWTLKT